MLCPNCGTKASTEQKFCRGCGMNLGPVARAVAAHGGAPCTDSPASANVAAPAPVTDDERRALRRMTKLLTVGLGVVLAALALLAAGMLFSAGPDLMFIFAAAVVVGLSVSLLAVRSPLRHAAARVRAAAPPAAPAALDGAKETSRLLGGGAPEPAPSVAEGTTELLAVPRRSAPSRDV